MRHLRCQPRVKEAETKRVKIHHFCKRQVHDQAHLPLQNWHAEALAESNVCRAIAFVGEFVWRERWYQVASRERVKEALLASIPLVERPSGELLSAANGGSPGLRPDGRSDLEPLVDVGRGERFKVLVAAPTSVLREDHHALATLRRLPQDLEEGGGCRGRFGNAEEGVLHDERYMGSLPFRVVASESRSRTNPVLSQAARGNYLFYQVGESLGARPTRIEKASERLFHTYRLRTVRIQPRKTQPR